MALCCSKKRFYILQQHNLHTKYTLYINNSLYEPQKRRIWQFNPLKSYKHSE